MQLQGWQQIVRPHWYLDLVKVRFASLWASLRPCIAFAGSQINPSFRSIDPSTITSETFQSQGRSRADGQPDLVSAILQVSYDDQSMVYEFDEFDVRTRSCEPVESKDDSSG